jgi:intracellular septation protein
MNDTAAEAVTPAQPRKKWVSAVADWGGLVAFLAVYLATRNLIYATWGVVVGSAVSLVVAYVMERRIAPMPLIAGGAALFFGSLTLLFNDPVFIKMKPTFVNATFAIALVLGLVFKRSPLKVLMGQAAHLPDAAWRTLTWRYAAFFAFVAVLNEAVWRTQPDTTWVLFRFPGLLILTILFSALQLPLFMRHAPKDEAPPAS